MILSIQLVISIMTFVLYHCDKLYSEQNEFNCQLIIKTGITQLYYIQNIHNTHVLLAVV